MTENDVKSHRFPLTGPLNIQDYHTFLEKSKEAFLKKWDKPLKQNKSLSDFQLLHQLASGTFGTVVLSKLKSAVTYHALKAIEKEKIMKTKMLDNTLSEKRILECINCPMTIYMDYFFKDVCYIYMVMPYLSGGELFYHIVKKGKLSEEQTRFVVGQIVIALEYLHNLDLIHRDIKPENIMLDDTGYVKLVDFGFCKRLTASKRTYTFCGTPEYTAPEVILNKGHGKAVDWWAIGVLLYELRSGRSPFADKTTMKVYERVTSGKYFMPDYFSKDLKDLIQNTIQVDLTRRFGNLKNGVEDIKRHKWFRSVDWLVLLNRKVSSVLTPFKPLSGDKYIPVKLKTSCDNKFSAKFDSF